jgi:hypothetical protein
MSGGSPEVEVSLSRRQIVSVAKDKSLLSENIFHYIRLWKFFKLFEGHVDLVTTRYGIEQ